MISAEQRYQTDPVFSNLVDSLYQMIMNAQFTPSELRDAVILAAIKYEMNHMPNLRHEVNARKWFDTK